MNDINYKTLYEQAQAKLDKIEYKELKEKINNKLGLRGFITYNTYKKDERLEALSQQNYFTFLSKIYSDEQVEKVIKEIGWEKLTKIIDDVYKEVLAEEAKEAEEEK